MSPTQLLLGYKPYSPADAKLLSGIQDILDEVSLRELRRQAKAATDSEQAKQKKDFDMRRQGPSIRCGRRCDSDFHPSFDEPKQEVGCQSKGALQNSSGAA